MGNKVCVYGVKGVCLWGKGVCLWGKRLENKMCIYGETSKK